MANQEIETLRNEIRNLAEMRTQVLNVGEKQEKSGFNIAEHV